MRSVPVATLNAIGVGPFGGGIGLQWLADEGAAPGRRATLITENTAWCPH